MVDFCSLNAPVLFLVLFLHLAGLTGNCRFQTHISAVFGFVPHSDRLRRFGYHESPTEGNKKKMHETTVFVQTLKLETGTDGLSRIVCEPGLNQDPSSRPINLAGIRLPDVLWDDKDTANVMRLGEVRLLVNLLWPPSIFHDPGVASSNNHVLADSWQEQYDSVDWQTTTQYSTQRSSQASSSEGCIKNSKSLTKRKAGFRRNTSQHITFPTTIRCRRHLIHITQASSSKPAMEGRLHRWSKQKGIDIISKQAKRLSVGR
ncbi:hypothetical protein PILCRDRAFT_92487 [Piloderma croceum F 1598]|uniref:Uncharacterized protein n=1 Tax=Piloderma croceum (strain F 1598) TaxID=765440 RepID=A0A0C3ALD9_PILCF|nr:hypothetical protein PILCRDRAFT_92487 [Piloderma croceum F 1598]